jgi:hypothetical protein
VKEIQFVVTMKAHNRATKKAAGIIMSNNLSKSYLFKIGKSEISAQSPTTTTTAAYKNTLT